MIPESAKEFIGKAEPPHVREVEKGAIRRYADAVGNNNPLYSDEEYARNSKHCGIIAPPGFFGWPTKPSSSSTGLPEIVGSLQAALAEGGFPYWTAAYHTSSSSQYVQAMFWWSAPRSNS